MIAQAAQVYKCVRPEPLHRNDAEVAAEVTRVAPADGKSVPEG